MGGAGGVFIFPRTNGAIFYEIPIFQNLLSFNKRFFKKKCFSKMAPFVLGKKIRGREAFHEICDFVSVDTRYLWVPLHQTNLSSPPRKSRQRSQPLVLIVTNVCLMRALYLALIIKLQASHNKLIADTPYAKDVRYCLNAF